MIELRILGPPELLHSEEGRIAKPILSQSKRFALLSYLALEGQARRDTILALFWPELDQRHAAAALRQSLYVLRGALGSDAVIAEGQRLGVDATTLWCDAAAFDSEYRAARLQEALALYRGPLLPGFHAREVAPEFEQWVELRRSEFQRRAVRAASRLSQQSIDSGDLEEAIRWARRGMDIDPLDEGVLRELLVALDAIGDRSAAVRAYDRFARRIDEEMDLAPAPETQLILQAIRDRRDTAYVSTAQKPRPPIPAEISDARDRPMIEAPKPDAEEVDLGKRRRKMLEAGVVVILGGIFALLFFEMGGCDRESLVGAGFLKQG